MATETGRKVSQGKFRHWWISKRADDWLHFHIACELDVLKIRSHIKWILNYGFNGLEMRTILSNKNMRRLSKIFPFRFAAHKTSSLIPFQRKPNQNHSTSKRVALAIRIIRKLLVSVSRAAQQVRFKGGHQTKAPKRFNAICRRCDASRQLFKMCNLAILLEYSSNGQPAFLIKFFRDPDFLLVIKHANL